MKILDSVQEDLVSRVGVTRVDLYILTTYSNRDAGTVRTRYYFSDRFRRYDYGNTSTVREFIPMVRTRTGPEAKAMTHIQDFGGSTVETFEMVLANIPQEKGGEPIIQVLRRDNLFRATIEVAELFLPSGHSTTDLTDFAGDEHTVVYRGEMRELVRATADTMGLHFVSENPTPQWLYADGATVDPRDLGVRLPLVYGEMKLVQAVGLDVGGDTTLASALAAGTTSAMDVTDASRFGSSGVVWVNGERIVYASRNVPNGTLNGLSRGTASTSFTTTAADHPVGSQVVEVQNSTFCVAGHPVFSIGSVFVRKTNGKLVRVTSGYATNTSTGAGPDGEQVATVSLTRAEMEYLLNTLGEGAAVTQQPSVNQQTTITTTSFLDLGYGTTLTVAGWAPQTIPGFPVRTGYANMRGKFLTPTPESEIGNPNNADHWDVTVAGGPLGTEPLVNPTATVDLEFFVSVGAGAGADNYAFAQERYSVAERDAGAGAKAYGYLSGPYTIPAGGTLDAFTVTVDFADVPLDAPGSVNVNRMFIGLVAEAGPGGVYFTNSPPATWQSYVALATSATVESSVTTDIEVAGDDASQVKIDGEGRGSTEPFSLRVFANVNGAMATASAYSVANGQTLTTMPDILRHFIAEFCDEGQDAVDQETFDLALANLTGNAHACDARQLGTTFAQVASRLAWESRANIQRGEEADGSTWRMFAADSNYVWPVPTEIIDQYRELEERGRDSESVRTRFRALYQWNGSIGAITMAEAYASALRADKTSSVLTSPTVVELDAAEDIFGRRDQDPFSFATIRDVNTADNVLGYYVSEAIRESRVWGLSGVPWTQAYKLEPGDTVELAGLPWATAEGWYARVLSIGRDPDSGMASIVLFMTAPATFVSSLGAEAELSVATLSVSGEETLAAALAATATLSANLTDLTVYMAAALSASGAVYFADLRSVGVVEMAAAISATATLVANLRQFGPVEFANTPLAADATLTLANLIITWLIESPLAADATLTDASMGVAYNSQAALTATATLVSDLNYTEGVVEMAAALTATASF